jgi:hypothetical protein
MCVGIQLKLAKAYAVNRGYSLRGFDPQSPSSVRGGVEIRLNLAIFTDKEEAKHKVLRLIHAYWKAKMAASTDC